MHLRFLSDVNLPVSTSFISVSTSFVSEDLLCPYLGDSVIKQHVADGLRHHWDILWVDHLRELKADQVLKKQMRE